MKTHDLKTTSQFFEAIVSDAKRFELRKDDRGYSVGDRLVLREWSASSGYTGRKVVRIVTSILYALDFPQGLQPGYCAMSVSP